MATPTTPGQRERARAARDAVRAMLIQPHTAVMILRVSTARTGLSTGWRVFWLTKNEPHEITATVNRAFGHARSDVVRVREQQAGSWLISELEKMAGQSFRHFYE